MRTEPELLNERLDRLAMVLDEIMPNCANLVRDALDLLKSQRQIINSLKSDLQETLKIVSEQSNVVRCKECRWAEVSDNEHTWCDHVDHEFCHNNDWFCADGERR